MKKTQSILAGLLLCGSTQLNHAFWPLTQWGTSTDVILLSGPHNPAGGPLSSSAEVSLGAFDLPFGSGARARALLTGSGLALPELHAQAVGGEFEEINWAEAYAVQAFRYDGTEPRTVDVYFTLNSSILRNESYEANVSLDVRVFAADGFAFNDEFLAQEYSYNPSDIGVLSFDVNPGDQFYLAARLIAETRAPGASADAWNSAHFSIPDPRGLFAFGPATTGGGTGSPVPDTGASALLLSLSLLGMRWMKSRS